MPWFLLSSISMKTLLPSPTLKRVANTLRHEPHISHWTSPLSDDSFVRAPRSSTFRCRVSRGSTPDHEHATSDVAHRRDASLPSTTSVLKDSISDILQHARAISQLRCFHAHAIEHGEVEVRH